MVTPSSVTTVLSIAFTLSQMASGVLTNEEARVVRASIYEGNVQTTIEMEGTWSGHRVLVVARELREIHKKKRMGTLSLLRDIVKGGRPVDALAAAAFAFALKDNQILALLCVDSDPNTFDRNEDDSDSTLRSRIVSEFDEWVVKARKE